MKRNKNIDLLRAFLIITIMFYHYTYRFSELFNIKSINFPSLEKWGVIGVGGFFIISGFFIIPSNLNNFSLTQYLKKKVLRIYPLYLISITIIFILISTFGLEGRECSFADYLLNVTMINGFINTNYIDGAHWYLTYLIVYYCIIGFCCYFIKNDKIYLPLWIIINDLLLITSKMVNIKIIKGLYLLSGGGFIEYIIIGILIRNIFKGKNELRNNLNILFLICSIQLLLKQGIIVFLGNLLFLILFIITINNNREYKLLNIGYKIGEISYVIYLIHQNIGYIILLKFEKIFGALYNWHIIVTIFIIFLISIVIFEIYEKGIQQFFKIKN